MGLLHQFQKSEMQLDVKQQVLSHLFDLLSTKRMFGAYQRDLGLDSYARAPASTALAHKMIKDIIHTIKTYEPRLEIDKIQQIPSESSFAIAFEMKCKIKSFDQSVVLSFQPQHPHFSLEVNP